jgi:hypothetical protein
MFEDDVKLLGEKSVVSKANFEYLYPDVYERIRVYSRHLHIDNWAEMKYLYIKRIKTRPVCKICGKPVEFISMNRGYKATCSRECDLAMKSRSHKKIWASYNNKEKEARLKQAAQVREKNTGYKTAFDDPEIRKKCDQTMLEKYGSIRYISEEGKAHCRECLKERRGDINNKISKTWSNKSTDEKNNINAKRDATCIERFGVDNYSKTIEFHDYMSNKAKSLWRTPGWRDRIKNTCLERYGVIYSCLAKHVQDSNGKQISQSNKDFVELLNLAQVKNIEVEFSLKQYSYDIKVGDLLIEIDPSYTHNSTIGPYFHGKHLSAKDKDYHKKKSVFAAENGYRCIHVWDWDPIEKIIYMLCDKEKIYARECEVQVVTKDVIDEFLNLYHLQNTCRGQEICLGLYYKNTLVEVMTFGKPRYNSKYQYELLRLCSRPDYIIIGGANKLFTYFIQKYNPSSILSYCDDSKFSGNVYTQLGMTLKSKTRPRAHWYNIKTEEHITDNLLRQRGADQLLGTNCGKGTDNKEIMIQHGFVEVYDCGQSVYTWNK